jgi:hypothetical protein
MYYKILYYFFNKNSYVSYLKVKNTFFSILQTPISFNFLYLICQYFYDRSIALIIRFFFGRQRGLTKKPTQKKKRRVLSWRQLVYKKYLRKIKNKYYKRKQLYIKSKNKFLLLNELYRNVQINIYMYFKSINIFYYNIIRVRAAIFRMIVGLILFYMYYCFYAYIIENFVEDEEFLSWENMLLFNLFILYYFVLFSNEDAFKMYDVLVIEPFDSRFSVYRSI